MMMMNSTTSQEGYDAIMRGLHQSEYSHQEIEETRLAAEQALAEVGGEAPASSFWAIYKTIKKQLRAER